MHVQQADTGAFIPWNGCRDARKFLINCVTTSVVVCALGIQFIQDRGVIPSALLFAFIASQFL
jgi:hypothetical protein